MSSSAKDHWQERSKAWTATAIQGISADDTFNQMIIAEAGIQAGEKILDLASGTGNPAVSIAHSMNGDGDVICADLTPLMLQTARQRAEQTQSRDHEFCSGRYGSAPLRRWTV